MSNLSLSFSANNNVYNYKLTSIGLCSAEYQPLPSQKDKVAIEINQEDWALACCVGGCKRQHAYV